MQVRKALLLLAAAAAFASGAVQSRAETLREALALAYSNNPTINAERARTRSVDELVAIAKSGYRPVFSGDANYGTRWQESRVPGFGKSDTTLHPGGFGITISQTLFDGFKTFNDVSAARSQVLAAREALRNIEQNVLFDAVAAYMDVIRDRRLVSYRAESLEFLNELVRAERTRFEVGESTRTDVAQAEGRQADAQALLTRARANLQSSIAVYRQLIGKEPNGLSMPSDIVDKLPKNIDAALQLALGQHPSILARNYAVDQAMFDVKSAESEFLPSVVLQGTAERGYDRSVSGDRVDSSSVTARLSVPIYQGGRSSAIVRQNKEILGQRRIEVDISVDEVRAAVVSAYSQYDSAKSNVQALRTGLQANRLALQGAIEERRVGQRTTLDVLDTEQDVLITQIALAEAERNVIVAGYAGLSAIGKLTARELGLNVATYDPKDHYLAVKDKWYGLRTPDGR